MHVPLSCQPSAYQNVFEIPSQSSSFFSPQPNFTNLCDCIFPSFLDRVRSVFLLISVFLNLSLFTSSLSPFSSLYDRKYKLSHYINPSIAGCYFFFSDVSLFHIYFSYTVYLSYSVGAHVYKRHESQSVNPNIVRLSPDGGR